MLLTPFASASCAQILAPSGLCGSETCIPAAAGQTVPTAEASAGTRSTQGACLCTWKTPVRAGTIVSLSDPGGRSPKVMKSSARDANSRLTRCSVARIRPLQRNLNRSHALAHAGCCALIVTSCDRATRDQMWRTVGWRARCSPSCLRDNKRPSAQNAKRTGLAAHDRGGFGRTLWCSPKSMYASSPVWVCSRLPGWGSLW